MSRVSMRQQPALSEFSFNPVFVRPDRDDAKSRQARAGVSSPIDPCILAITTIWRCRIIKTCSLDAYRPEGTRL